MGNIEISPYFESQKSINFELSKWVKKIFHYFERDYLDLGHYIFQYWKCTLRCKNVFTLAAWPGFAGPPARGVLVILVQDVSKAFLVIGLFRVALVQGLEEYI